jgi:endonuclease/exonuclease/phosphatase family metal-dependent hydrolase
MDILAITPPIKLNILSWNLHAGIDWYGRFLPEQLIACIKGLNPDLCGFQEVDRRWSTRSKFEDLAQALATSLTMHAAFSPSLTRKTGSYGNLILSRYPLVNYWLQPLPDSREPRSFCCVQTRVGRVKLGLLTTHLGLTAPDRYRQVEQIQRFISRFTAPLIICGDFNAGLEDCAVQRLTGKYCDLQQSSAVVDAGTFRLADGQVGPRIDYILTTPEFTPEQFQIISNYCSDHLPLFATVSLGRQLGPVVYL